MALLFLVGVQSTTLLQLSRVASFFQNGVTPLSVTSFYPINASLVTGHWSLMTGQNPVAPLQQKNSQLIRTFVGHTAPVRAVAIAGDGLTLASGGDDGTVKLWNFQTGQLLSSLSSHSTGVKSIAISPDGQTLVSGGMDGTVKLWDLKKGQLLRTLNGHKGGVTAIAITSDGRIVTGSLDIVKVWDMANGKLLRTLQSGAFALTVSRDGETLFAGHNDGKITLWNLITGKQLWSLVPPQKSSGVTAVAIAPDGQTLVNSGGDDRFQSLPQTDGKNLKVWDMQTRKLLHNFSAHLGTVESVAIAPNGLVFASGGHARRVQLWSLKTGKLLRTFEGHGGGVYAVTFSPNGQMVISGSGDKTIKVWRLLPSPSPRVPVKPSDSVGIGL
ncbi:WD40 repeat domain-containing protein [Scytonema sp. UIC 10036]|uniref:WD40 repeat domain-containing protein n=1 Tax=Scytonema sp. UIC 10036 TaxID=2304196 RepID=UPI00140F68CF|nr:WD40 repeat domain-containing protein [Scytonema sp. UIC 10036]